MPRSKKVVVEYRVYDLPPELPAVLLDGDQWRISDEMSDRLHFHNCMEIGVCHTDGGLLVFEDETVPFRAGDVAIIPRHLPHTTCSDKGTKSLWTYLFIDLPGLLADLLPVGGCDAGESDWMPHNYLFSRTGHPRIHFLVGTLIQECRDKKSGWDQEMRGLALVLHHELIRLQNEQKTPQHDQQRKSFVLKPALEFIQNNYMLQTPTKTLADLCHLSETHFRRLFLATIGVSPLNFINATRISQARVLLDTTDLTILSIAETVGISSISSFNRNFHHIMGISPREYRNAAAKPRQKSVLTYKGWLAPEERPGHVLDEPNNR